MAELADARDLGSRAARRVGSSPTFGTSSFLERLLTGQILRYYSADRNKFGGIAALVLVA